MAATASLRGTFPIMSDLDNEDLDNMTDAEDAEADDKESIVPPPGGKGQRPGKRKFNLVNDFGKQRGRTKDGKKFCAPCGKWLDVTAFPAGSAQCGEDRKAIQTAKYAAQSQGQMEWWEEISKDPEKLRKVCKAIRERKPPPGKKRKESFQVLQYIEERRQETAVLYDGVQEMMNELAFVAWMGKAKNGSMNPVEASALFKKKCIEPGAIVDEKGNHEKFRKRVAVLKADLVTNRDAAIQSQGYVGRDKEIRKGGQADVDRLEARLGKESLMQASSARTRNDMASAMVSAAASAASSGTGAGAFSNKGISAMHLGNNIKDLLSESENEEAMPDAKEPSDPSTPAKATSSAAADEDSPRSPARPLLRTLR